MDPSPSVSTYVPISLPVPKSGVDAKNVVASSNKFSANHMVAFSDLTPQQFNAYVDMLRGGRRY